MRLDFNILWVDDQPARVDAQRARIEMSLHKEGFRLQTQFATSIDEAVAFLSDDIYGDHIDLVLMDYDLGAGGKGDEGLVRVRHRFQYKDIVFYSSQAPDLPDLVAAKRIQGVYCSTREDLTETVGGVFDALVKKVLDIDHSRGIVMGATSDIDHHVITCLSATFENGSETDREAVIDTIKRHLKEKEKSFQKDLKKIEALVNLNEIFDHHHIYTSNDRIRLLRTILESFEFDKDELESIRLYLDKTVPKRNDLAHLRVRTEGFSRRLYDRYDKEFTVEEMRSLRQQLLQYHVQFEQLPAKIQALKK